MAMNKFWLLGRVATKNICQPTISFTRLATTNAAESKTRRSTLKLLLIAAGVGGAVGTGYTSYISYTKSADPMLHHQKLPTVVDQLPNIKITKKFVNPNDTSNLDLILFQFQTCPFCCKVRAFLDSQGLSYSVVEVDAVLRQDLKWSSYKKVPLLLARRKDGKYVQLTDSTMIISTLASFLADPSQDIAKLANFYPTITYVDDEGKTQNDIVNKYFLMYQDNVPKDLTRDKIEKERKWRNWADSHLVHLISPNVYRNTAEALETFQWFSDIGEWDIHFPRWERNLMVYVGAAAMWGISKRLKKRHGLNDDVRSDLYEACNKWIGEVEQHKSTFHGGAKPDLADLTIFGILNSMEGCQAFVDCLHNSKIGPWFYAMKEYSLRNKANIVGEKELVQL